MSRFYYSNDANVPIVVQVDYYPMIDTKPWAHMSMYEVHYALFKNENLCSYDIEPIVTVEVYGGIAVEILLSTFGDSWGWVDSFSDAVRRVSFKGGETK